MSTFGRALGGLGAGVSALSSKYIDEELAQQRAQALADMQFANQKRAEDYQQSGEVQGRRLVNQRNELAMRNEEGLKGRVAEASSPELREAKIANEVSYLQGTTPARVAAENALVEGTAGTKLDAERTRRQVIDPMDVRKAAATADATWAAREKYDQRLEGRKSAFERLPEAQKLQVQTIAAELKDISSAVTKAQAEGMWSPESTPSQQQLLDQKAALQKQMLAVIEGRQQEDRATAPAPGSGPPGPWSRYAKGGQTPAPESPRATSGSEPKQGTPPAEAQPAEEGSARGLMSKASQWFSQTGRDYSTPEGKQALRQRVAEAQAGGNPLSDIEQLRARQLGLI